ncbi:acyl-CoA dehydratase activase [Anaerosalibacter massiliensis]|uniref:Acyl-CoA dehydratase activase n=1 Tax=Anaerosalibacter massiliensis TaxID=1347392 RepID=A0A9X2S6Z0_9FIRM|nr:acyl-CoA dehydratase activase [Anaerosalibacter massiliensis]MCR2044192.1 acyl-CoA dehydratase activase [Anaerosalibacter massiliensis]
MYYAGVDIGSTAAKTALFENDKLIDTFVVPTGWSSIETANIIKEKIVSKGIKEEEIEVVATGYGRVSVPYANKTVTEITCHGKGAAYLTGEDCTVVDIGGQDTKVITVEKGMIVDFLMNDKCSAGTGRFLEIMANTLGVDINTLCDLAETGSNITISSMCTVFAESEVISLIGRGEKKEDIAYAVVDSIVSKVASLCNKHSNRTNYYLTGGLCECDYIVRSLSKKLKSPVKTNPMARYAGAIGAGVLAQNLK